MTPNNSGQNALSLVDIPFVRTEMVERELVPWSGVSTCCSNSFLIPC